MCRSAQNVDMFLGRILHRLRDGRRRFVQTAKEIPVERLAIASGHGLKAAGGILVYAIPTAVEEPTCDPLLQTIVAPILR